MKPLLICSPPPPSSSKDLGFQFHYMDKTYVQLFSSLVYSGRFKVSPLGFGGLNVKYFIRLVQVVVCIFIVQNLKLAPTVT
jgi:hypothetical protein